LAFLQYFDAVGLVIWRVKIVPEMTYKVSSGTLSLYALTTVWLVWPLIKNAGLFGRTQSPVEKDLPVMGQTGRTNEKEHTHCKV